MVLSRWPKPPGRERATLSRCLISSGVRYSRGRTAALVVRRGVIVRFSMVGPPFAFTRKPLFLIGSVYPIVRISAKKLSALRCLGPELPGALERAKWREALVLTKQSTMLHCGNGRRSSNVIWALDYSRQSLFALL